MPNTIGDERSIVDLGDGTIVDAITGYRTWIAMPRSEGVFLRSVYTQTRWDVDMPLHEKCLCGSIHGCTFGARIHTCGIYAYRSSHEDELLPWLGNQQVIGEVALWGKVRIHERGYRAEWAKIKAIYTRSTLDDDQKSLRRRAAETYGVPLVTVDSE